MAYDGGHPNMTSALSFFFFFTQPYVRSYTQKVYASGLHKMAYPAEFTVSQSVASDHWQIKSNGEFIAIVLLFIATTTLSLASISRK